MPHGAYPTAADLSTFLTGAGLTAQVIATLDMTTAAAAGIATFESGAGRERQGMRMLGTVMTRVYDAPVNYAALNLGADLLANTGMTVAGRAYVLNTDYYLKPDNADVDGRAWTWIEFDNPYALNLRTQRRAISIPGTWGRATTLPDDAWVSMVLLGLLSMTEQLELLTSGGLQMWVEAAVTEKYGGYLLVGERIQDRIQKTIKRYEREESWV